MVIAFKFDVKYQCWMVVVIMLILWLLSATGVIGPMSNIRIGR